MQSLKISPLEILDLIEFRWSAFVIYSVASIFSVSLRLKGFEANPKFIQDSIILGIGITSFTLFMLIIGFKILGFLRSRNRKCRFGVLLLLPLIGALRGVALYLEIDRYGYANRISITSSTISSLMYTSIFYGGASIFMSLLLKKNRLFHNEFQQAAFFRLKRELESSPQVKTINYEEAMQVINSAITSKILNLTQLDVNQIRRISEEIKFQIQNVIRPLSHRLWIDSFGEIRAGNPMQILKDAVIELKFSKPFIVGYQFIIGIFGIGISIGIFNGIFKSTIGTLTSLLIFYIYENFWLKRHLPSLPGSIMFLLVVGALPVLAAETLSALMGISTKFLDGAIIAPTLPAILVVSSVYGLIVRDKEFALSAARTIKQSESNNFGVDAESKESRELSEYLHNTLQSELLRIAKKLDITQEVEEADAYLSEMNTALSRTRSEVNAMKLMGIERLESVCQSWEGIATITLKAQDLSGIGREKIAQTVSLVEEIISNTIRFGGASEIQIELISELSSVHISIHHNGSQHLSEGKGLGSISLMSSGKNPAIFSSTKSGVTLDLTI